MNRSWEDDADTLILGDDLLEEAPSLDLTQPNNDDELDTIPYGSARPHPGPLEGAGTGFTESTRPGYSTWDDSSVDEYLSEDVLEEAEPSAPSFSRPTFEGPLVADAAFSRPAASVPAHLQAFGVNPLRRSSVPPAPLPPLPSRYDPPPQRAEMPTPVMEIFPTLDAIRPESRPPPPTEMHPTHLVHIPPPAPVPTALHSYPTRGQAPPFPGRASVRRGDAHLDTLRPYAASTRPGPSSTCPSPGAGPQTWGVSERPWAIFAEKRWEDFVESCRDGIGDLANWIGASWDSVASPSRVRAAAPKSHRSWQKVRATASQAARLFNARTATWALGVAFVALLVVAVRAPGAVSVSAAPPPPPILVDADAINPAQDVQDKKDIPSRNVGKSSDKEDKIAPLLLRAREGDRAAIAKLNAREPTSLSLEEVQALAVGEEKVAREDTARKILKIARKRRIDAEDRAAFLREVGNPRTYREALLAMAENRSWQGPDLIYLALRRYRSQQHVADFAHALLLTPRIYKYASPALTVVIDAESMTGEPTSDSECFHVRQLVDRAYEEGDNRAVLHMARFASTTGCGEDDAEDCYPCLREDSSLVDALRVAKTRLPPF